MIADTTVAAWARTASPVGDLVLTTDGEALTGLRFAVHAGRDPAALLAPDATDDAHPVLAAATEQVAAYFDGRLRVFDLPLRLVGTAFQRRVWDALTGIAYGATAGYGEIAGRLGLPPGASRAVGLANAANPVSVVVPCHRVVGASGALTGYAGGLERKRFLLDLESDRLF